MGVTKYQLLYRYINEGTNTAITNSMNTKYEEVMEFYTDPDHMIFSTDEQVKSEAIDAQQEMISYGNSGDNPKTNMIFAYNGTKKIKHKRWVNEQIGYEVRDWSQIKRSNIGNEGDFTKEFTTLNASTPENGGIVACTASVKTKYFPSTITIATNNELADAGTPENPFYSEKKINQMITESTFFQLTTEGYVEHIAESNSVQLLIDYTYPNRFYKTIYIGPVAIGGNMMRINSGYQNSTAYGQDSPQNLYSKVTVNPTQLKTLQIPGHYEDANDYPYLVKDTYKRIQLSPWFVNCTCGSLEAALAKAKILADMIGLDNVKLIKVVPFDQSIKIN